MDKDGHLPEVNKMGKTDFDNLIKVMRINLSPADTTLTSVEIDFEIPRGFIVKIHKIVWNVFIFITIIGVDAIQIFQAVLIRDPDDATTIVIPINQVQHDVISQFRGSWITEFTTSGLTVVVGQRKQISFRQDLDVVTARNMRMNVQSSLTTMDVNYDCEIYYTLEKVTDIDILNLLDIL